METVLPMEVVDWAPNAEELYSVSELRNILIKTIEELQPILRTVFVLQDLEGLSTDQTAEVLNLSRSAVKSRLWRARLQLRERLNKYFGKSAESAQVESLFYKRLARATPHSHRLVADQLERHMIQRRTALEQAHRDVAAALSRKLDNELTIK